MMPWYLRKDLRCDILEDTITFAPWKALNDATLREIWDRYPLCAYCEKQVTMICVELDLPIQTYREADRCVGLCSDCWRGRDTDVNMPNELGIERIAVLFLEGRIRPKYEGIFQGIEV